MRGGGRAAKGRGREVEVGEWTRRRLLQAAVAGTSAAWWPASALFADGALTSLLRARKEALVIGNGRYRNAPLRNPVNDAADVAATLKEEGFTVTLGLDLTPKGRCARP
jgi:hypothetical protein